MVPEMPLCGFDAARNFDCQSSVSRFYDTFVGIIITGHTVVRSLPANRQSLPFSSPPLLPQSENIGSVTRSGNKESSNTRNAACAFQADSDVPLSTRVIGEMQR